MPTYASNQTKKREFFRGGEGGSLASKGVRSLHRDFKEGSSEPLEPPPPTRLPVQAVKAVTATVPLDQLLYDKIIRKQEYTNAKIVNAFLEDFFVFSLARRLQTMFIPIDHSKFPEQIGKAVSLATLRLTTIARCRMLYSTYPCEHIMDEDKRTCSAGGIYTCYSQSLPPPGYKYGTWPVYDQLELQVAASRQYQADKHEPMLILEEKEIAREKRAAWRPPRYRSRRKKHPSVRTRPRSRNNSPNRRANLKVMKTLGAGSSIGTSFGAGKVRPGAQAGMFNTLSLQDMRRMSADRPALGSRVGSPSLSKATGVHIGYSPPVSLTNLRARPFSLDSHRMNPSMAKSSSSVSSSFQTAPGREVSVSRPISPAVPQLASPPKSGWHDMPPLEPPYAFSPKGYRPVPARRNLIGDQPLTRSNSVTSLDSIIGSRTSDSRPPSRITNEQGSFLPQVREDFKVHNRVRDAYRIYKEKHPYKIKAGKYNGGGIAALGSYIGASQIDRAIQRAQDKGDDKTEEKHTNETATLEADLLKEKLANELFKQQSEFASKVSSDAILTGQIPTALAEQVVPRGPEPEQIRGEPGTWTMIDRNDDPLRRMEPPRQLANNESELVVDRVQQNMMEVEKMLTRRKELILREEEEEVQQPKKVFNALDRLNQQEHFHFELPERERVPRALPRDWDEPGTLKSHKKIVLAWCIGSAIFASMPGFIVVMWSRCWCCCRKRAKKPTPVDFLVEPLELEPLK